MGNKPAMGWVEFRYLNGVRRNNQEIINTYDEYLKGLQGLNIATANGQIEKKIAKITLEMANLNTILTTMIEKERVKDITLYLEDI